MTAALVPNGLWDLIEPFLPRAKAQPKGGGPRLTDRACLTGIVFVLRRGIPWEMLPQELGCGSGRTCWRCLRDWQEAGICTSEKSATNNTPPTRLRAVEECGLELARSSEFAGIHGHAHNRWTTPTILPATTPDRRA